MDLESLIQGRRKVTASTEATDKVTSRGIRTRMDLSQVNVQSLSNASGPLKTFMFAGGLVYMVIGLLTFGWGVATVALAVRVETGSGE